MWLEAWIFIDIVVNSLFLYNIFDSALFASLCPETTYDPCFIHFSIYIVVSDSSNYYILCQATISPSTSMKVVHKLPT